MCVFERLNVCPLQLSSPMRSGSNSNQFDTKRHILLFKVNAKYSEGTCYYVTNSYYCELMDRILKTYYVTTYLTTKK